MLKGEIRVYISIQASRLKNGKENSKNIKYKHTKHKAQNMHKALDSAGN
jgi:hypothetical protein